jgi:hypothetical protein
MFGKKILLALSSEGCEQDKINLFYVPIKYS